MPTNQIIANIGKSVMFLLFFLICCPVDAQEQNGWTANDSVRLAKMLNGEIPIHIDDTFKKELEQSMIGHPILTIIDIGMISGWILISRTIFRMW